MIIMKRIKLINITFSMIQSSIVLFTAINILYCLTSGKTTMFFGSLDFCFTPYFRYTITGSIPELLVLVLFIAITVFLSIKTLIEAIDKKGNNDIKYTLINFSWIFSSMLTSMPIIIELKCYLPIFSRIGSLICIILLLMIFIFKISNKNKNKTCFNHNYERKNATYQKICKSTKEISVIYFGFLSFVLLFRYYTYYSVELNNLFVFIINIVYLAGVYFSVGYFITTVKSINHLRKSENKDCLPNYFFKKIYSIHIISFILFALSYVLILFSI